MSKFWIDSEIDSGILIDIDTFYISFSKSSEIMNYRLAGILDIGYGRLWREKQRTGFFSSRC